MIHVFTRYLVAVVVMAAVEATLLKVLSKTHQPGLVIIGAVLAGLVMASVLVPWIRQDDGSDGSG